MAENHKITETLNQIVQLVEAKKFEYGDSFVRTPKAFAVLSDSDTVPNTIEAHLVMRILDKICRIMREWEIPEIKDQSDYQNPWEDLLGYVILGLDNNR